jgi:hypothetical protein
VQPTGPATTSTTKHNFAVRNLYLGDANPGPTWENLGYNIDGQDTTSKSTNVCTNTSNPAIHQNGTNGIDNAFGAEIVKNLASFITSGKVSTDVQEGKFTLMIDTVGLSEAAGQTNTGLSGSLFAGDTYSADGGAPPQTSGAYDVSDNWPVNGALLNGTPPSIAAGSKITFPNAYVTGGVWASNQQSTLGTSTGSTIALQLALEGVTLSLTIHAGVITMPVTYTNGQYHATSGVVSGVLKASELTSALAAIVGKLGECAVFPDLVLPLIEKSEDLSIDDSGNVTNTMGETCNAISIGLGFDADEIAQPSVVAPAASDAGTAMACAYDAGTGG